MTLKELYSRLKELAGQRNVFVVDDDEMPTDVGFLGLYIHDKGEDFIWIKPSLPLAKKIFVLAHELGHFKLHRTTGMNCLLEEGSDPQKEAEATEYGRRLIRFLICNAHAEKC